MSSKLGIALAVTLLALLMADTASANPWFAWRAVPLYYYHFT